VPIYAFAEANPAGSIFLRKPGSGKACKIFWATKMDMMRKLQVIHCIIGNKLKKLLLNTKNVVVFVLKLFQNVFDEVGHVL
jgi:hypothetical protein